MSRLCEFDSEPSLEEILTKLESTGLVHNDIPGALAAVYKPAVALDIGTSTGDSARKMAEGGAATVYTFDTEDHYWPRDNTHIVFHQKNLCDPAVASDFAGAIARSTLVFLDVDPHDGLQEPLIVANLRRHQQQDIVLVCDDIDMTPGMRQFWSELDAEDKISLPWAHPGSGLGVCTLRRPQ